MLIFLDGLFILRRHTYGWCWDRCGWFPLAHWYQTSWTCCGCDEDYFMDPSMVYLWGWILDRVQDVTRCFEKWLMVAWGCAFSLFEHDSWTDHPTSSNMGTSSVQRYVSIVLEYHGSGSHEDDTWRGWHDMLQWACSLRWRGQPSTMEQHVEIATWWLIVMDWDDFRLLRWDVGTWLRCVNTCWHIMGSLHMMELMYMMESTHCCSRHVAWCWKDQPSVVESSMERLWQVVDDHGHLWHTLVWTILVTVGHLDETWWRWVLHMLQGCFPYVEEYKKSNSC